VGSRRELIMDFFKNPSLMWLLAITFGRNLANFKCFLFAILQILGHFFKKIDCVVVVERN
jgi:hypothetical protein